MPNYRGGERGISTYGAETIKAIKEGQTQQQQNRNLREKILMGLAQAGLAGARGAVGLVDAADERHKAAMANLSHEASTPAPDYKPMAPEATDAVPAWLKAPEQGKSFPTPNRGYDVPSWVSGDVGPGVKPDADTLQAMTDSGTDPEEDKNKYATWGSGGRGMMGSQ